MRRFLNILAGVALAVSVGASEEQTPEAAKKADPAAIAKQLGLPDFHPTEYRPTARDPFIDASVQVTILGAAKRGNLTDDAKPIDFYCAQIQGLLNKQFQVRGIAYDPTHPMALIGGKILQTRDPLYVKLPESEGNGNIPEADPKSAAKGAISRKSLRESLLASSKAFGLGIEHDLRENRIRLIVRAVRQNEVLLLLPGATQPLVLRYEKDFSDQTESYASSYAPAAAPRQGGTATAPKRAVTSARPK